MRSIRTVLVAFFSVVLLLVAQPASAQEGGDHSAATEKATKAVESWLTLVDENAFDESWEAASSLLQERIDHDAWAEKAGRLRDSIQTLATRTLTQTQYRDSLRRASRGGPFVLLKYRSTFEAGRVEELVLAVRQDTTWKVAGYQVTPLPPATDAPSAPPETSNP